MAMRLMLKYPVILSLSAPEVPGVAPPIEIPYPTVVLTPVLILQFLIVLLVAPNPAPKLIKDITEGAVVAVFVMVRFLDEVPLLEPSIITLSAPFNTITAPDETAALIVGVVAAAGLMVSV